MNYEHFDKRGKNIFLIDMKKEKNHFFSDLTFLGIKKIISKGGKVLLITNKKGYDTGIICQNCGYIPKCEYCDISLSYHKIKKEKSVGLCNLCKQQYGIIKQCPKCHQEEMKEFGLGIQKVEYFLEKKFNKKTLTITSKEVNSLIKIKKIQKQISKHQIIIATSILTQPFTKHLIDLCVILDADTGLQVPDFNSQSKTFRTLYEIFIKYHTKNFIVQTKNPDNLTIRNACYLDKKTFFEHDKMFRENNGYPPFNQICIIIYKNSKEKSLHNKITSLYQELIFLKQKYNIKIDIYTSPPLIYKQFNKFHYHILLRGKDIKHFIDIIISKLNLLERGFRLNWKVNKII